MNKKVSLLIIAIIMAVIVFLISTYLQKKVVNYVPTVRCLISNANISEYSNVEESQISYVDMPVSIVANSKPVKSYNEIENLYLKDKLYKGQLLLLDQFGSKEILNIFDGEEGKEKISIKIKNSENAASYILKKGSAVNVYATINNDYAYARYFQRC